MAADVGGETSRKLNACDMSMFPTREEQEWAGLTVDRLVNDMAKSDMSKSALSTIASELAKDIVCRMPREEFREVADYTSSRVDEEIDNLIGWGRTHTVAGAAYPKGFLNLDLDSSDEEDDQSWLDEELLGGMSTISFESLSPPTTQSRRIYSGKQQDSNNDMPLNRPRKKWDRSSNGRLLSNPEALGESLRCERSAAMGALEAGGLRDEHKLILQTELLPAVFSAWLAPVFEGPIVNSREGSSTSCLSNCEGKSPHSNICSSILPSNNSSSVGSSETYSELGGVKLDAANDYRTRSAHLPHLQGTTSSIHSFYHDVANSKLELDAFERLKIVCCDGHGLKVVKHNHGGGKNLRILKLDPVKNEFTYTSYRRTGINSIPCRDLVKVLREDNVTYLWYTKTTSKNQAHKKAVGFELQREHDARVLQLAVLHIMKTHSG